MISIGDRGGSTITTPSLPNHLTPIIDIVPLQLLAAYVAVAKGINPDVPRSLVKTTTAI
jgi:glucosamine--fructose-6-phosphate aminotransferase (isomerizing)